MLIMLELAATLMAVEALQTVPMSANFPNISYELLKRGYNPQDIRKIWGSNLLHAFREVEKVSVKLDN